MRGARWDGSGSNENGAVQLGCDYGRTMRVWVLLPSLLNVLWFARRRPGVLLPPGGNLQPRAAAPQSKHLQFAPTTVAAIYKQRWQVELFFKVLVLKQLCKIKNFVGTSANAVKTQVWTALIAMLLLRFQQLRARFEWALPHLLALLRQQLFAHRDLCGLGWTIPSRLPLHLRNRTGNGSGLNETAEPNSDSIA